MLLFFRCVRTPVHTAHLEPWSAFIPMELALITPPSVPETNLLALQTVTGSPHRRMQRCLTLPGFWNKKFKQKTRRPFFFCCLRVVFLFVLCNVSFWNVSKGNYIKATKVTIPRLSWKSLILYISQGCRFGPYTFSDTIRHRWYQAGSKYWFPPGFGGLIQGQIYNPVSVYHP